MIWGLSESTFTLVHVVLSLVGIAAGLVTMFGLVAGKRLDGWTAVFLAVAVLVLFGWLAVLATRRFRWPE